MSYQCPISNYSFMDKIRKKFSHFYIIYVEKIYRFVYLKVSSQEIAEDLTSRVFTQGWNKFRIGQDIKNPRAYIYQIARNEVVNYYREKSKFKTVSVESVEIVDPQLGVEEKSRLESDLKEVKKAISCLNDDYQNVIIWRYLDNLPIKEIAGIMEKPEGTVRVMLHRALNEVKKKLEVE